MKNQKLYKGILGIALLALCLIPVGHYLEGQADAAAGKQEDYYINVPFVKQAPNKCNRYAVGAVIDYVQGLKMGDDKTCRPFIQTADMAAALNRVDWKVRYGMGTWVMVKDFHKVDTNTILFDIKQSIGSQRPVIIGNGLYKNLGGKGGPGHFYIVRGYYKQNNAYRLYLRDGSDQNSRDFKVVVNGQTTKVDPTTSELQSFGPNKAITLDGTKDHSVLIYFKPTNKGVSS